MNEERTAARGAGASHSPVAPAHLSAEDVWHLTLYKWRYSLESHGFAPEQVRRLLFLKWLYSRKTQLR